MRISVRLIVLIFVVIINSVAFAGTPQAAGGGPGPGPGSGNLPAGTYHFTTLRTDFNLFGTFPDPQIGIFVTGSTQVSKPEGGRSTTTSETDVFINISSQTGFSSGCIVLASPSDFSQSSRLTTASLHTTITVATPSCSGFLNNFPVLPFTLDVTWTGTGPIAKSRGDADYKCGSYTSESTSQFTSNNANATASLTPLFPGPFTVTGQAGLSIADQRIRAEGVSQDACPPAFGGKGTGFGPQPPGSYHFTTLQAGSSFTSSAGDQVGFFISNGTQTFMPDGGPASTTHETDLFIQINGSTASAFACFIIPSTDFTSTGVQTAALHTTVTTGNAPCAGPSFGTLPLPLTLDVIWSGTGPMSTLHQEDRFNCLRFSTQAQNVVNSNPAAVVATATPLFTETLTSNQGSLVTGDQHIDVNGVETQTCLIRG